MPRNRTSKPPPPGYEVIEPVIEALENELRDKVKESNLNKRNTESMWPVHQINWQRTRYIYDMYYTYNRISKKVYDYCIKYKIADGLLIAKWKKPGYERLCSTYVINPSNYKFGTTSICRVPIKDRGENAKNAIDPTTGCMGCASGKDAGPRNIFGNKYGQNLAAVFIAREKRMAAMEVRIMRICLHIPLIINIWFTSKFCVNLHLLWSLSLIHHYIYITGKTRRTAEAKGKRRGADCRTTKGRRKPR